MTVWGTVATEPEKHSGPGQDIDVGDIKVTRWVELTHGLGPAPLGPQKEVRLLDASDEFTAEVVASATGDFRFFAAPGTWTLRALSPAGNGDASVAPSGAGIHEVDVKVA